MVVCTDSDLGAVDLCWESHNLLVLSRHPGADPSTVVCRLQVDRKLIGGFVLEFEDRLVDMSVAKKLEEFNNLVFKLETDLRP